MRGVKEILLSAVGGAVTGDPFPPGKVPAGAYAFDVAGTLGGATVKLQVQLPDGATWIDLASVTVAGRTPVLLAHYDTIRAVTSGGVGSSITATIAKTGD